MSSVGSDPRGPEAESERFYERLTPFEGFASVLEPRHFAPVPPSWLLIITDVEGSTRAIEAGRYKDVNALGVASIVAVRNAVQGVAIPYVFGGDGATLLVPGTQRAGVEAALRGIRAVAQSSFGLALRAAIIPISELAEHHHHISVARFRASPYVSFAVLSGDGLQVGEYWAKHEELGARFAVPESGPTAADFTGFECRWQPIPAERGRTVSLLVVALDADEARARQTYQRVLAFLDKMLEQQHACSPVNARGLRLGSVFDGYSQEARFRAAAGNESLTQVTQRVRVATLVGKLAMALGLRVGAFDGRAYRDQVLLNSDFRKFDGTLRMVLDMGESDQGALESFLESEHRTGALAYGVHSATSALMTCLVQNYDRDHVHFIDGSDGGYALAAKALKRRIQSLVPVAQA